ncbi:MAG TPA: DUF2235 domain-containing protein [Steroidobacteraceae bacterium]|nr:DUF2235 domain-containing protein [Steroidobacteraceae bacterium]
MKRLVICADGTWNYRDQQDDRSHLRHATNVTKVARAVLPRSASGVDQVVIYHDGIGTQTGLEHLTGGITGLGIEGNIRDLYRSVAYNYVAGDELYLFGFSRGAYTIRTLAGFMFHYGLLQKGDDFYVPDLFAEYEVRKDLSTLRADPRFKNMGEPRPCPPLKFIGVWDTVGALGLPGPLGTVLNGNRFAYHDIDLNDTIQNAYHALAIDERRVPFAPSLWSAPDNWSGRLEQTWFCGVHCNVGGGYNPDGLANEALHWMVEKATLCGLEFSESYLAHYLPCFNSVLNDSMTVMYRLIGEHVRPVGVQPRGCEQIHRSVLDRLGLAALGYDPPNLSPQLRSGKLLPIVDTSRIARGAPCLPAQEHASTPR